MQLDFEKFEADMAVFSLRQHQEALTYSGELEKLGWTFEDTKIYLKKDQQKRHRAEGRALSHNSRGLHQSCPECSAIMFAYTINTEAGNQTDNPEENSVWLCQSSHCGHAIYNKETVNQLREV